MHRNFKRITTLLVVSILVSMLNLSAFAASTFDIEVVVNDLGSGRTIYNVATLQGEVSSKEGYIQSEAWTIPELSSIVDTPYGSCTGVTGNWYTPVNASVGATVYWSVNTATKRVYYNVTNWQPGTGSGSATGGSNSTSVSVGYGSRYTWTTTFVYHSNYPNGTDVTYTQPYSVSGYGTTVSDNVYTYNASPLNWTAPDGYEAATGTLADGTRVYPWNTAADGSGTPVNKAYSFTQSENGKTIHLYAQWVPVDSVVTPDTVTLTSKDGDTTYAEQTYFSGDEATTLGMDTEKDGQDFEGWDTSEDADTVVYESGDGFEITEDTIVWAVWGARQVEDTVVLSYDANGGTGAPEGTEDSGVTEGEEATFTVTDTEPTYDGKIFLGWSTTKNGTVEYEAGDELKVTTDTILYAVWEDEEVIPTDTIVLTYDANNGTGAPSAADSGVAEGTEHTFTVSDTTPARDGYIFLGWSSTANGEVEYKAGDEMKVSTDTTIYAVWQVDTTNPDGGEDSEKVSEPGMDKKSDGADSIGTVEPGDTIKFTLNSHVGEDLADTVTNNNNVFTGTYSLLFKDTLTGPASVDTGSFVVKVGDKTLTSSQYTLDTSPADGSTFNLTIDVVSLLNDGTLTWANAGVATVTVDYTATVSDDAIDGDTIRNDASVNDSVVDTLTGTVDNTDDGGGDTPVVPDTGSKQAVTTMLAGSALICAAGVIFVVEKKKRSV